MSCIIIYELFLSFLFRRKQFMEKVLDIMQDEITERIYEDLINDLEGIRYP